MRGSTSQRKRRSWPADHAVCLRPAGNLDTLTLSNDVVEDYDHDGLNPLEKRTAKLGQQVLFEQDYAILPDGQRDYMIERRWHAAINTFSVTKIDWEYGALNRLTHEVRDEGNDGRDVFSYDLAGNRLSKTIDLGNDGSIDQVTAYRYNTRDQLVQETTDSTAVVVMILTMAFLLLSGCGSSETDVTALPKYNFSSFAGTTWKTKTKVALADLQHDTYLLAPRSFDSAHPEYQPPPKLHVLAVLPVGTRLRIDRLMEFRGNDNCVLVIASLIDEAGARKTAYLDYRLLAGNAFMGPDSSLPPTWAVNPDLLEAAAPQQP